MKKIISIILAAIMILSIVVSAFAANVNISANKTAIKKGETVDVTVSLSETVTDVVNMEYSVFFDPENFELASSKIGDASPLSKLSTLKKNTDGSYYSISIVDTSSEGVEVKAGTIYTLTFKAIKDVTEEEASSFEIVKKSFGIISGGKPKQSDDGKIGTGKAEISVKVKGEDEITFSEIKATVSAPAFVESAAGNEFSATIYSTEWDENKYKLLDALINIPEGLEVTSVTVGDKLSGGDISYYLSKNGLRIVYNDPNEMTTLSLSGTEFPAVLFQIGLKVGESFDISEGVISIVGMSLKLSSDSEDPYSQNVFVIPTEKDEQGNTGRSVISFTNTIAIKAAELFVGDGVDIIPQDKKAVLISVTGLDNENVKLAYKDGENTIDLYFSEEISTMVGTLCYVAIVDSEKSLEDFTDFTNYTVNLEEKSEIIVFGDTNGDKVINAQDAVNIINTWIRKTNIENSKDYLVYNVNSDARINTYDALAIEEEFINSAKFKIVTRAAALTSVSE